MTKKGLIFFVFLIFATAYANNNCAELISNIATDAINGKMPNITKLNPGVFNSGRDINDLGYPMMC